MEDINKKELRNVNCNAIAGYVLMIVLLIMSIYNIINNKSVDTYFSLMFMYFGILNICQYINCKKKSSLVEGILFLILLIFNILDMFIL